MKLKSLSIITLIFTLIIFSNNLKSASDSLDHTGKKIRKYSIEQFYKNQTVSGGFFSNDEMKLLVSSNLSGIFNLYEINPEDNAMVPLTFSTKESMYGIDYVPGTKKIIYLSDKGGNEIDHIYLLNEDGTSIELTTGEKEIAEFLNWSTDKKFMFYTSNKRDPNIFDLYKMSIDTWHAEMIYQNDEGNDIWKCSSDGNILAFGKYLSKDDTKLYLLDLSKNLLTEISDSSVRGIYLPSDFSKDGKTFFYITDAGKEFKYLVKYDIATGNKQIIFETDGDVMYSQGSENEKYRIIAVNEEGRNKIIIRNNVSGENIDFPDIMDGDIISAVISESEKLMALKIGTSKTPGDLYLYNFESNELKRITNALNKDIDPGDLVSGQGIYYKSLDGLDIHSILYKPLIASEQNKVPALVMAHGGPASQSRIGYSAIIQFLVNHGYAVLAVNYRGSTGYGKTFLNMDTRRHGKENLMDCVYGKKYLQSLNYIDGENIGIMGGSYGGFLTMAAMTFHPNEFKVGVNAFGVTNWIRTLRSIPAFWGESAKNAMYSAIGNPYTSDSILLYDISPLFHADKIKNPVMILHGANDPRVLKIESDEIVDVLKKNNVPVEYLVFPDEGHGFVKRENEIKGYGSILKFLDKYLKSSSKN